MKVNEAAAAAEQAETQAQAAARAYKESARKVKAAQKVARRARAAFRDAKKEAKQLARAARHARKDARRARHRWEKVVSRAAKQDAELTKPTRAAKPVDTTAPADANQSGRKHKAPTEPRKAPRVKAVARRAAPRASTVADERATARRRTRPAAPKPRKAAKKRAGRPEPAEPDTFVLGDSPHVTNAEPLESQDDM